LYPTNPTGRQGRNWNKERQREEQMKLRRRSSPYTTKSAGIDYRQKLNQVGIDDEDKESIDEENNVRYLRMN
jgi:hypothetical protein